MGAQRSDLGAGEGGSSVHVCSVRSQRAPQAGLLGHGPAGWAISLSQGPALESQGKGAASGLDPDWSLEYPDPSWAAPRGRLGCG